jgi:HAAS
MNLLNRYLQAVARCLPSARRDDIIAELRANILSQMEDRERELGHPLTEDEQADILRRYGNPTIIAGRYSAHNIGLAFGRQLIGPELFPFYKTVLIVNLLITVVVLGGVMPVVARAIGGAITLIRVFTPLAVQFGIVTLVFVILDRNKGRLLDKWDPRRLPALKANPEDGPSAQNIFNFIAVTVGTLWLALTPRWPYLLLGPGALYLQALPMKLMPQWIEFYWAIVLLLCAHLVLGFFRLFRLLPRRQARIMDLTLKGVGLCIGVLLLLQAPNYVSSQYREVAAWANLSFLVCLIVVLAINLWGTGRLLLSLWRERDQMLPAQQH